MITMIMRDKSEIQHGGKLHVTAMDKIYRKKRFARLDDIPHVIDAPNRRDVTHFCVLHFVHDLFKCRLQFFKAGKAMRSAISHVLPVDFGRDLLRFIVPHGNIIGLSRRRFSPCHSGQTCRNRPGDKLPSVRSLAVELAINPNTIQRAYSQLEAEGYLLSVSGKGTFVAELQNQNLLRRRELEEKLRPLCQELRSLGMTAEEWAAMWEGGNE